MTNREDLRLLASCDGAKLNLCKPFKSTNSRCTAMDHDDSRGLLKGILGFFARKLPESLTPPTSLRSQALDAWVRTDAYLQHETNDFDEIDTEQVARTLRTFENLVQYDSDREQDSVSIVVSWRISLFQPLTSCRLTQGCGAEITPHCGIPKASGGSSYDRAFESRCVSRFRLNHPLQQTQARECCCHRGAFTLGNGGKEMPSSASRRAKRGR